MRLKRLVLALALLTAFAACEPANGPSNPIGWGPISSSYNGQIRVRGDGRLYNDRAVNASNLMRVADMKKDGNSVYGVTNFYFRLYDSTCSCTELKNMGRRSTKEWQDATHSQTVLFPLDPGSSYVRGASYACAQMGWPVPNSLQRARPPDRSATEPGGVV